MAFLYKPVDAGKPRGDWYLIEARGVMSGVVETRLLSRKPDFWGLMTKYYDYGAIQAEAPKLGDRLLKNGCEGADVKQLQSDLIRLGYDCGRWGADGDFGDATELAVKAFQRDSGLAADGICGPKTCVALEKALAKLEAASRSRSWWRSSAATATCAPPRTPARRTWAWPTRGTGSAGWGRSTRPPAG